MWDHVADNPIVSPAASLSFGRRPYHEAGPKVDDLGSSGVQQRDS